MSRGLISLKDAAIESRLLDIGDGMAHCLTCGYTQPASLFHACPYDRTTTYSKAIAETSVKFGGRPLNLLAQGSYRTVSRRTTAYAKMAELVPPFDNDEIAVMHIVERAHGPELGMFAIFCRAATDKNIFSAFVSCFGLDYVEAAKELCLFILGENELPRRSYE